MEPKIYLVGGAVRDKVLGREVNDLDYVVVGGSPEWMEERGFKKVGKDFPVYLHPETGYEYALARQERKSGKGYHGFEVKYDSSVTLEDDLMRRDLTINAMAYDEETGRIIDPFGGMDDLRSKVLRHTSDAFAEDPLRVLRLARFAARYSFTVAPETVRLAKKIVPELAHIPKPRIWTELSKGLKEPNPMKMVNVLQDVGAAEKKPVSEYIGRIWVDFATMERHRDLPFDVKFLLMMDTDSDPSLSIPSRLTKLMAKSREFKVYMSMPHLKESQRIDPETVIDLIKSTKSLHQSEIDTIVQAIRIEIEHISKTTRGFYSRFDENYDLFVRSREAVKALDMRSITEGQPDPKERAESAIREAVFEIFKEKK